VRDELDECPPNQRMDVPGTSAVLNTPGEKLNWTMRLSVNKGVLTTEVYNLSSIRGALRLEKRE
jgi:hypothetical protein